MTATGSLTVRPHDDGFDPPAWEIVMPWGGVLAVVFPGPVPCPLEIDGDVDARAVAHLMAASPALRDALEAAQTQIAFMASVIKSGESWTPTLEASFRSALDRARAALAAASPPADAAAGEREGVQG